MDWIYVLIAGLLEVIGVNYMNLWKRTHKKYIIFLLLMIFISSLILLHLAMYTLPMSVTYAAWTGIGAVGGILLGIVRYGEEAGRLRLLFMGMIVFSVIGLKLLS